MLNIPKEVQNFIDLGVKIGNTKEYTTDGNIKLSNKTGEIIICFDDNGDYSDIIVNLF